MIFFEIKASFFDMKESRDLAKEMLHFLIVVLTMLRYYPHVRFFVV